MGKGYRIRTKNSLSISGILPGDKWTNEVQDVVDTTGLNPTSNCAQRMSTSVLSCGAVEEGRALTQAELLSGHTGISKFCFYSVFSSMNGSNSPPSIQQWTSVRYEWRSQHKAWHVHLHYAGPEKESLPRRTSAEAAKEYYRTPKGKLLVSWIGVTQKVWSVITNDNTTHPWFFMEELGQSLGRNLGGKWFALLTPEFLW